MTKRHPVAVVALTLVTFTVYAYYWLYKTTDELRRSTDRHDLRPIADVLLTLITFGVWGIWAGYRNAKIVHEAAVARGREHSDRSLFVGAFGALSFVSGWAWLVSMALLQEDYNRLAEPLDRFSPAIPYEEAASGSTSAARARAATTPAQVRVGLEPERTYGQPAEPSRWERAPSAPVFESTAPAPIVF